MFTHGFLPALKFVTSANSTMELQTNSELKQARGNVQNTNKHIFLTEIDGWAKNTFLHKLKNRAQTGPVNYSVSAEKSE